MSLKIKLSKCKLAAWLMAFLYFGFFSFLNYFQYKQFLYHDYDLAIDSQILFNLTRGSWVSSILGVPFLANHFVLVFYPLSFLYRFFESPLFLLSLQSFCLAAGGILTFQVARHFLSLRWSLATVVLYFIYPPVASANFFEFHPTTLAVPFLFLMILSYFKRRLIPFLLWALLAMGCQENIPLAVLMFTAVAIFERRGSRWAFYPISLAALYLYLTLFTLQPRLREGAMNFPQLYSYLGDNWQEIFTNFFIHPGRWLNRLFCQRSLNYLIQLTGPLLFLPFVAPAFCLPVIPLYLQHVLSDRGNETNLLHYHYSIEMVPFIFTAAIVGISTVLDKFRKVRFRPGLLLAIGLLECSVVTLLAGFNPYQHVWSQLCRWDLHMLADHMKIRTEFLKKVPSDASIVATFEFLPPLSNRAELYSFHHLLTGCYSLSNKKYVLPETVQYVLIDWNDTNTSKWINRGNVTRFADFIHQNNWQILDAEEDIFLLKKTSARPRPFDELFISHPASAEAVPQSRWHRRSSAEIQLLKISVINKEGRRLTLRLDWKASRKPTQLYAALIGLTDKKGRLLRTYKHQICYGLYPTNQWRDGEVVSEFYNLLIPEEYFVKLGRFVALPGIIE